MDLHLYIRAILSLAFVLGLILLLSWAVRRFNLQGIAAGSLNAASRGRARRLTVVESIGLDARRRLVLVRRDGVEHLLMLGLAGEHVVEAGIIPPPGALSQIPGEA